MIARAVDTVGHSDQEKQPARIAKSVGLSSCILASQGSVYITKEGSVVPAHPALLCTLSNSELVQRNE